MKHVLNGKRIETAKHCVGAEDPHPALSLRERIKVRVFACAS